MAAFSVISFIPFLAKYFAAAAVPTRITWPPTAIKNGTNAAILISYHFTLCDQYFADSFVVPCSEPWLAIAFTHVGLSTFLHADRIANRLKAEAPNCDHVAAVKLPSMHACLTMCVHSNQSGLCRLLSLATFWTTTTLSTIATIIRLGWSVFALVKTRP